MAAIHLNNIVKAYGSAAVVNHVSFAVKDGEFIVLVGPSGCGKSTTLRMVAGLDTITSGEITIGDRVVNDVDPQDRDIAMVFQSYALYPHMSVYDNIAFGLRMRHIPTEIIGRRIATAVELLGLEPLLKRKPRDLSGGQRQRVALGRAIVREPSAFLMDEPLSNLDAKLRVQMRATILKLHKRLRTTVMYVTHDQIEAMTMGDRIVVMFEGTVQQIGTPIEVYERPANRFVAGFIGSPAMNFMDCTLERVGDAFVAKGTAFSVDVPAGQASSLQSSGARRAVLGVRPEDISISSNGAANMAAHADVVEVLGSEKLIIFDSGAGPLTARLPMATQLRAGDAAQLRLEPEHLHFFAADTGVAYY